MQVSPVVQPISRRSVQEVFPAYSPLDLRRLDEELDDKLPLFDPTTSPKSPRAPHPACYRSNLFNEAVELGIFLWNRWVAVTNKAQFKNPPSSIALEVGNEQLAISLDKNDKLRAFHNACFHHSYTPVDDIEVPYDGKTQCGYHGGTVNEEGHLCVFKGFGGGGKYSKEDLSIPQFEVDTWGPKEAPIIFVRMEPDPDTLETTLAPLKEKLKDKDLSLFRWHSRREYIVNANWIVFVNNYKDGGFHVEIVHPELTEGLDLKEYKTLPLANDSCLQTCPTKGGNGVAAAMRQGTDAQYFYLFPNFMLDVYTDAMDTMIVTPIDKKTCKVIFDFYFTDKCNEDFIQRYTIAKEDYIKKYIASSDLVQRQDMRVSQGVQKGLGSPRTRPGLYGKTEIKGLRGFHQEAFKQMQKFHAWLKEGLKG